MLRMPMLKLPPEIRILLATEVSRPFGRQPGLHALFRALVPPVCSQSERHDVLEGRRHYATVNTDDTTKLWSGHGRDAPSNSAGTPGIPEETPDGQKHAPAQPFSAAKTAPDSREQKQVQAIIESKLRKSAPSMRRRLRHGVNKATESPKPVAALRDLAYRDPQTWESGKSAIKDQPSISVNTKELQSKPEKADQIELLDIDYILTHKPLPTKEDLPESMRQLLVPDQVANFVNGACGKLKYSMQSDVNYSVKQELTKEALHRLQPGLQCVYICSLKVEISDIIQESAAGEGVSKLTAKQAAWLHMVSKMHAAGMLKELFPFESASQRTPEDGAAATSEQLAAPSEVDEKTMEEEKDARSEIYNYAASLGLVPKFETKLIRTPRARRGQIPKKSPPLYQVSIQLEGQRIHVTASGKDWRTAETAAAIAFKEQAEKKYKSSDAGKSSLQAEFSVLNVENARKFIEFYKNRESGVSIEVEHELLEDFMTQHRATLAINGNKVGQAAVMRTKNQAESIAFLTSAVEIATAEPGLLLEFAQTLKKGKGNVLRQLSSIDMEVEFEALQSMRNALVEARNAGLPDIRQRLDAAVLDTSDEVLRRTWRLSPGAHANASEQLRSRQELLNNSQALQGIRSKKAGLPMNHYRTEVLQMVDKNQYSIVVGATGSGKTTQVPQILFEEAINNARGSYCNIICTQPRRIAATSVAQRVATERNETLRETVGYHVRFDARLPHEPYGISYCTTGVLLEKLKHDPNGTLDAASHIIIDEVHERDLNIDFLMIVLKRAIQLRRANSQHVPKVILMSATLDAELFAKYFHQVNSAGNYQPCPTLNVPGRSYPVTERYLGSIMHELIAKYGAQIKTLMDDDNKSSEYLKAETAFSASRSKEHSGSGQGSIIDWKRERQLISDSEEHLTMLREKEEALVPVSILVTTIAHICTTSANGAILAFLPGLEEILEAQKMLLERDPLGVTFSDGSKFQICILHSSVPKEQQAAIFERSPMGSRKIILSTNIAETSVTVPEVKYVVDSGKLREKRYDQLRRITKLQCVWESKSNLKQRAGRAGRVQDGFYFALFSKERSDSLSAVGLPELLRSDLQETCLSIKSQDFGESVASFLSQAIEPPLKPAIEAAVQNLISIEAFTPDEDLTALGKVLSQLPVHPTLAKMIILGIVFRCIDPMIVIGAGADERALFVRPLGARQEADRAHRAYAGNWQSDHIAFLKAFNELRTIRDESDVGAATRRAHENFLHMGAFRIIDQTAKQIEKILEDSQLIVNDQTQKSEYGPAELNRNSQNHELIRALLLAGFNPNLASKTRSNGLAYRNQNEQGMLMHPSSLNVEPRKSEMRHTYGTLFTYSTLSRSTDGKTLFLRDSTRVTPLMATLFGGELRMNGDGRLEMDEWLPFFVKAADRQFSTRLILEFRKALDRVLNSAFSSLSDRKEGQVADLVSDPMREKFAQRVVEVLNHSSGSHSRDTGGFS